LSGAKDAGKFCQTQFFRIFRDLSTSQFDRQPNKGRRTQPGGFQIDAKSSKVHPLQNINNAIQHIQ
jgi:hypothetical protein